ncbi:MAG: hypothetical protein KC613_26730 [Myxococcales bacterium]|nr:hypothetical protein [Myxococcales bacterium]MCB9522161.1 hypothetical protein [Myxococcales bacterium]
MPIEGEDVELNFPPFYFFGQIRPAFTRTVTYDPELDPEGAGVEFSTGPLGDPNDGDRLFWRWFFNYGVGSTAIEAASPINGLAPEQRGLGVGLQVRPCEDLRRRFPEVALHRIELVLADRPFAADDGQGPRNQALPEDAGQVRLVWYLAFDPSRCPL